MPSEFIVSIRKRLKFILIINTVSLSLTDVQLYTDDKQFSWYNVNIFGFQLLSDLESDHLFTFNSATIFHQYCTTFTFPPLRNITKNLFTMQRMVIPLSFTFKSPALNKYASVSSLSKPWKFLILQFLVKCYKLESIFKILSKSHMLDIFSTSSMHYKFSYKL